MRGITLLNVEVSKVDTIRLSPCKDSNKMPIKPSKIYKRKERKNGAEGFEISSIPGQLTEVGEKKNLFCIIAVNLVPYLQLVNSLGRFSCSVLSLSKKKKNGFCWMCHSTQIWAIFNNKK